jgi:predicted transcriptional regulator
MSDTTTITVRVSTELRDRLEVLAKSARRSKSFLSNEAIERYVENEELFLASLDEAERDIDVGRFYTHEEVERMSLEILGEPELKKAS